MVFTARVGSLLAMGTLAGIGLGPEEAISVPADLPEALVEACRSELPDDLVELASPESLRAQGPAGKWFIASGQMDGAGSEEAILVVLPRNRPGTITFFAEREDRRLVRKKISLKDEAVTRASVSFPGYRPGHSLAHVDAGDGGQVLLCWTGRKLVDVWKVGRPSGQELSWFELEDLDGDEIAEVISYVRREVDVYADEEIRESGGVDDRSSSSDHVTAVAVHRLANGKWKKDKKLLEGLR
jgi:hypothetical protein